MSNFFHAGVGLNIKEVTSNTSNLVADFTVPATANSKYTEWYAAHLGRDTLLHGKLAAVGAGTITVQKATLPTATVWDDIEVIDVTGKYQFDWSAGQILSGQVRLLNSSGVAVTFYANSLIN